MITAERVQNAISKYQATRQTNPTTGKHYYPEVLRSLSYWAVPNENSHLDVPGLGRVEFVADVHDDGQMYWLVFSVEGQLFGCRYQYSSWDENYIETYMIVPVTYEEVTVRKYRADES